MTRVAVAAGVLRWAVERAGRSGRPETELQKKFPKMQQWLSGEIQPTLRQLEDLAKATLTPFGFFFLEEPPEERMPVPHFRTVGDEAPSKPSPDLLETVHMMQRRQDWMREFLVEEGHEPLPFIKSARISEQPATVAQFMRDPVGFDEGWVAKQPSWTDALGAFREAIEGCGIFVVVNSIVGNNTHRKLDPEEFRGFVMVDEYAPLLFVNGADGKAAQMFTLAHELAHVFFGSSAAFDLRQMLPADDPTEKACNRVAAEFLVPERQLHRLWPSVQEDAEPFQSIARQFKVSALVAARRALDLTLISKEAFLDFYSDYQRDERRAAARRKKKEGGDFYATQNLRVGRRFGSAVIRAAREGKLLYSEAYQLTDLYGDTFERYAVFLEGGGSE